MRYLFILLLLSSIGCNSVDTRPFMRFHQQVTKRLVNYVMANNEAGKYKDEEASSRAYLLELSKLDTAYRVAAKLKADGFSWHKEAVDFVSIPWVTVARKRGDCDDFMALWEAILKDLGDTKKVSVRSKDGRGHAMLLFNPTGGTTWYILSNTTVRGVDALADTHRLIRLHYGENTDRFIIY